MNKRKIALYPTDYPVIPFLKYDLVKNIVACYTSDTGSTLGKKITYMNSELMIEDIRNCKYSEFDILWVVNSEEFFVFERDILPIIEKASNNKKTIFVSMSLSGSDRIRCQEICNRNGTEIRFIDSNKIKNTKINSADQLLKISVPIVFVLGIYEHTNKLDTILYLHKAAIDAKYNVKSILTKNNDLDVDGFYSFPMFMFDDGISDRDKILLFNHYIRKIEKDEKPDIIIIGIPGEIMPINRMNFGNFAVMPFLVSNAIQCDYAVLKLFNEYYNEDFANEIRDYCENKFNLNIDSFAVSENIVDISNLTERSYLQYYFSNHKHHDLSEMYYFNYTDGFGNELKNDLIQTLQEYGNYNNI